MYQIKVSTWCVNISIKIIIKFVLQTVYFGIKGICFDDRCSDVAESCEKEFSLV